MSTFTKEQLIARINQVTAINKYRIGRDPAADGLAMDNELFAIALASLEAEAVAMRWRYLPDGIHGMGEWNYRDQGYIDTLNAYHLSRQKELLYTAPPSPVSVPEPIMRNDADGWWMYKGRRVGGGCAEWYNRALDDCRAAMLQGADGKPELTVWYGSMPESNGKANWTAIMHRKGEGRCIDGFTIDRSEYPGRVLYAADRVRYLIGEKSERPSILDYDADAHSGYVKPGNSPGIPDGWVACSERMPEVGVKVLCFPVNDEPIHATYNGQVWLQDISWSTSDEPIDNVISCNVFHWMPLPAAPKQEVKS